MKKFIAVLVAVLLTVAFCATAAADTQQNKTELLARLKEVLNGEEGLDIYNQVEKIIQRDEIEVSDDQLASVLAIDYSEALGDVEYKGIVWSEYTDSEQASAMRLANEVCDILGLTFNIDPSNDSQREGYISISVYKDGKLMGVIDGDAKTDVVNRPVIWYLVGGGVLVVIAIVLAVVVFRRRDTANKV
ncbi:MAG: hypothetical protein Q4C01_02695 [Clostridia bacterium]|nr:hypothetical protein [Clostridia bacterium]